jgi:hypothetical protein
VRERPIRDGERARRLVAGAAAALNPLTWKIALAAVLALVLVVVMAAAGTLLGGTGSASATACTVSGGGPGTKDVPQIYLRWTPSAVTRFELGPRGFGIVLAIHDVESDFGRSTLPGVHSGENSAGAGGPGQFLAATWEAYGVDMDGDGRRDRYSIVDSIGATANYLHASGLRPGAGEAQVRGAIFAYNHADWYVNEVLELSKRYGGEVVCEAAPAIGGAQPQRAVRLFQPRRFVTMPGWAHAPFWPRQRCDARMSANLLWLLAAYRLRIHDCRAGGHNTHGDGTAADITPKEDTAPRPGALGQMAAWRRLERGIRALGWRPSCGATGCMGAAGLSPAIRAIFYNGFDNHGDPRRYTGSCGCPHVHISWMSSSYGNGSLVAPNQWTMAFPINGQILTGTAGFEQGPA